MIVDTSAIVAILKQEKDAARYEDALASADEVRMSAATLVETGVVVDGSGEPILQRRFDDLLEAAGVVVEPFTWRQAEIARQAYRDFGKGSKHPAQLNLGDCFAYALARELSQPLLYKGADFAKTDIVDALVSAS